MPILLKIYLIGLPLAALGLWLLFRGTPVRKLLPWVAGWPITLLLGLGLLAVLAGVNDELEAEARRHANETTSTTL